MRAVRAPALASALPLLVSTKATGLRVNIGPSDTEEDNTEDEASTASVTQPAQETPAVAKTPSPTNRQAPADSDGRSGLAGGELHESVSLHHNTSQLIQFSETQI